VPDVQARRPGAAIPRPAGSARDEAPWYSQDVNHPGLDAYKIVLYRQEDGSWVAEVPAISGCYALMPTREEALAELGHVFDMIAEEYQERGAPLPEDTTEIVNA
jgi:predicted RNase H-like HicB family nuclease